MRRTLQGKLLSSRGGKSIFCASYVYGKPAQKCICHPIFSECFLCLQATADDEDVDVDEALGNKSSAASGKKPPPQIAGNLCPPSESKGANGDFDMVSL